MPAQLSTQSYDMQQYQAEALATESPVTPEMQKMLVRCWEIPAEQLFDLAASGQQLDRLKRTVYYGKVDGDLMDELMPSYPTGEKRERIEQCTRIMHAVIGLITEIGELAETMTKHIDEGSKLDVENIKEEGGDLLWYLNLLLACCGTNIPAVAEKNVAKLQARYPGKFDALRAVQRNLPAEQRALTLSEDHVGALQHREKKLADDLKCLLKASRRLQLTPVVDDDFPGIKHELDTILNGLCKEYGIA